MTTRIASVLLPLILVAASTAHAQSFELGAHVVAAHWSEFKGSDAGIGARIGWKPTSLVGVEAEANWYPGDFPEATAPFSSRRIEAILALTAGPRVGRIRPFVRGGAGFLRTTSAGPFACIAIFPPPLSCLLAGGDTLPTVEIGGGVEVSTPASTFIRFDVVDRILRYPGPTFGPADEISNDGFFGHAFKFALGAGWRF